MSSLNNRFSKGSAKNLLSALDIFIKKYLITLIVLIAKLIKGRNLNRVNNRKKIKQQQHTAQRREKNQNLS